ncbi:hypothetical protein A3Q56_02997 [Intoshia linei]|uniref:DH domain-containing protein n=1 Tax=Intoshia linei TaxID=1819745 RepID=A0A177B4T3_9BILA|nr:hypothetical protein A3Q56_02997 [Intoshia linei]
MDKDDNSRPVLPIIGKNEIVEQVKTKHKNLKSKCENTQFYRKYFIKRKPKSQTVSANQTKCIVNNRSHSVINRRSTAKFNFKRYVTVEIERNETMFTLNSSMRRVRNYTDEGIFLQSRQESPVIFSQTGNFNNSVYKLENAIVKPNYFKMEPIKSINKELTRRMTYPEISKCFKFGPQKKEYKHAEPITEEDKLSFIDERNVPVIQDHLYKKNNINVKVNYILRELIDTENNYVNSLKSLNDDYMTPLKKRKILSVNVLENIFYKINELYVHHAIFLSFLNELSDTSDFVIQISKLICHTFSKESIIECYVEFVGNITQSKYVLENCYEKISFKKFVESIKTIMPLNAILFEPVQRIPRYVLLIENLAHEIDKKADHQSSSSMWRQNSDIIPYNQLESLNLCSVDMKRKMYLSPKVKPARDHINSELPCTYSSNQLKPFLSVPFIRSEHRIIMHSLGVVSSLDNINVNIWLFEDSLIFSYEDTFKYNNTNKMVSIQTESGTCKLFLNKQKIYLYSKIEDMIIVNEYVDAKHNFFNEKSSTLKKIINLAKNLGDTEREIIVDGIHELYVVSMQSEKKWKACVILAAKMYNIFVHICIEFNDVSIKMNWIQNFNKLKTNIFVSNQNKEFTFDKNFGISLELSSQIIQMTFDVSNEIWIWSKTRRHIYVQIYKVSFGTGSKIIEFHQKCFLQIDKLKNNITSICHCLYNKRDSRNTNFSDHSNYHYFTLVGTKSGRNVNYEIYIFSKHLDLFMLTIEEKEIAIKLISNLNYIDEPISIQNDALNIFILTNSYISILEIQEIQLKEKIDFSKKISTAKFVPKNFIYDEYLKVFWIYSQESLLVYGLNYECYCKFDVHYHVADKLKNSNSILSKQKLSNLQITTFNIQNSSLIIGTSAGLILIIYPTSTKSGVFKNDEFYGHFSVTVLNHAFVGAVRSCHPVFSASTEYFTKSQGMISIGKGYHNYTLPLETSNNAEISQADNTNNIILYAMSS